MDNESQELFHYLEEIAQMSFNGEIPWTQPNPSTFQWEQKADRELFQIVIQKAIIPKRRIRQGLLDSEKDKISFLFKVVNRRNRQTNISISSAERPEFDEVLSNIFGGASKGIDKRSSNVLRKILQNKKS